MKRYFIGSSALVIIDEEEHVIERFKEIIPTDFQVAYGIANDPRGAIDESEIEDEDHIPVARKTIKKGKKGSRKPPTCKTCGSPGHNSKTCSGKIRPLSAGEDNQDDLDELNFKVTAQVKSDINEMMLDGLGSRDIATHYNISIKLANHAIAQAKGIELPR